MMSRKNFRESSGVVVDVCPMHGIWFDRGELTKIIEFAATGAMAKTERGIADRAESRKRLDAFARELRAAGPHHYWSSAYPRGLGAWSDPLLDIAKVIPGLDPEDD
jgi:Zn-finger nucleic acid-binding protein